MGKGPPKTTARQVAEEYLKQNEDVPNRTAARVLRTEYPELFRSVESARSAVRKIRGNSGELLRKHTADKSLYRENGKAGEFKIPKGLRQGHKPHAIKGPIKLLVLSDIHVPYHDERAIVAAVEKGLAEGCDGLYLNGDTIDFYSISRWQTDPRERDVRREVDTTIAVLDELSQLFPKRWYKCGNHDERWDIYLFNRAEDLVEFDQFSMQAVLKLDELGYQWVHSKQWTNAGKLHILHGHEFVRGLSSPVNPARGLWLKLTSTALAGHLHQTSHHSDTHAMTKTMVSCWSTGCLCDLQPAYAPLNKWNLGFGIVELDKTGNFQVQNFKIDPKTYEVFRA